MPSSLYQRYQQNGSLMESYQNFRMNPMQNILRGFDIPKDMNNPNDILQHLINTNQVQVKIPKNINNPNDILQYLLTTGQISQQQVNSAMQRYSAIR